MRCKHLLVPLISVFLFTLVGFTVPSRAHAFFGCIPTPDPVPPVNPLAVPTSDALVAAKLTIANLQNSAQTNKECIADALVTMLAQSLIDNLTGSIVDWINNDFEGGPAFVTDPAGFFVGVGDQAAGQFIENELGPLGALLCSPFDLQLRFHLFAATTANRKQYIGCRLSDIEKNVYGAFTEGSFIASGGWRTWHAVTSDPRNNRFGAFLLASDALNTKQVQKINETLRDLSYGGGFLSYKRCVGYEAPTSYDAAVASGGQPVCTKYKVETPGSVVQEKLNSVLGVEENKLTIADEINEIFGALINYGLRNVFASGGGLRSVGTRTAGASSPTVSALKSRTLADVQATTATTTAQLTGARDEISKTDPTRTASGAGVGSGTVGTANEGNIARAKLATQSDTCSGIREATVFNPHAEAAVDGNRSPGTGHGGTFSCTKAGTGKWWEVDLETEAASQVRQWKVDEVKKIEIYRVASGGWDGYYADTFTHGYFRLSGKDGSGNEVLPVSNYDFNRQIGTRSYTTDGSKLTIEFNPPIKNVRFIRIEQPAVDSVPRFLTIAEIEVFGTQTRASEVEKEAEKLPVTAHQAPTAPAAAQVGVKTGIETEFTANTLLTNVQVGLLVEQFYNGAYKPVAPSQFFATTTPGSSLPPFLVRVKNTASGALKFPEERIDHINPVRYFTIGKFNAAAGETVGVGYELTPKEAARGSQFRFTTEIMDAETGRRIPGAVSELVVRVGQ